MKTSGKRKNKRGASVLLLSIFFMAVLFLLAASLYRLIPAEMHAAYRTHEDTQAHYVARAGIQQTMSWLQYRIEEFDKAQDEKELPDYNSGTQTSPSYDNIVSFLDNVENETTLFSDWRYEIEIEPMQDTIGLKHGFEPRYYSVRSTAFHRDRPIKEIAVLLKQRTFSSFAFYTAMTDGNSTFVIDGKSRIFGPVHTNSFFRFSASESILSNPASDPYFTDIVSFASPAAGEIDGNVWPDASPNDFSDSNPVAQSEGIAARYETVFEGGQDNLRVKNSIALPSSTEAVLGEVWPADSAQPIPSVDGVYIAESTQVGVNGKPKVNGGLFVQGESDRVRMFLDDDGNQKMIFVDDSSNEVVEGTKWVNDTSKPKIPDGTEKVKDGCKTWKDLPDGGGSGVSGGTLKPVCEEWNYKDVPKYKYPQKEVPNKVNKPYDYVHEVIEAVEAPYSYVDENGATQQLKVGQTLVVRKEGSNFDTPSTMDVKETRVYDGMINGSLYVNDNVGNENNMEEGIWGIVKGSAVWDHSKNDFQRNNDGDIVYQNKTLVTPLNKSVSLGGDLLQFDQDRFEKHGSKNLANITNAKDVALDPNAGDLSPNNNHVFGIISRDVWMKGERRTDNRWRNGYDGYNDVYAIVLAGVEDKNGNVSGGFGTWKDDRDATNDGLGRFRIFGGVIQGTTGANHGDNSSDTHYWQTAGFGYEVDMYYDLEATRQRLFPTFPEFRILRYLENSARK